MASENVGLFQAAKVNIEFDLSFRNITRAELKIQLIESYNGTGNGKKAGEGKEEVKDHKKAPLAKPFT